MRRIALLSDIHGNLEALEAVLRDVERQRPDMVVVLGDTINYGPNPRACLERVERTADIVLAGNHEKEAAAHDDEALEGDAREMLDWTLTQLEGFHPWEKMREHILAAGEASSRVRWRDLTFVHGSPRSPVHEYIWPGHPQHHLHLNKQLDEWLLKLLKHSKTRHSFCGHTHVPALLTTYSEREIFPIDRSWNRSYTFVGPRTIFYVPEDNVTVEGISGSRMVINPGSVGQPRDGNPLASWALYEGHSIHFRRVAYDMSKTSAKIRDLPLSAGARDCFADRILEGV
ncbi:MAG: metallophosphoesterase [Deltaproteobacteria bacterium]|nr:metallophosphoesterase [Deltaproteobacteria bacterium]